LTVLSVRVDFGLVQCVCGRFVFFFFFFIEKCRKRSLSHGPTPTKNVVSLRLSLSALSISAVQSSIQERKTVESTRFFYVPVFVGCWIPHCATIPFNFHCVVAVVQQAQR
jgi:hypothetical protein